jgi:hypothetical protein
VIKWVAILIVVGAAILVLRSQVWPSLHGYVSQGLASRRTDFIHDTAMQIWAAAGGGFVAICVVAVILWIKDLLKG